MAALDRILERAYFHDHYTGGRLWNCPDPKACPFCGSPDAGDAGGVMVSADERGTVIYQGVCNACGACGPPASSQSEAALAWNRRL